MRKYFIYLFAAVALMSACTETGPMEKPANRKDSGKSLFIGTIEQPGAPLTKTHMTGDCTAERESIAWDEGDEIYVLGLKTKESYSFYADQTGDEANFWNGDAEVPAWLTANDEDGYIAYYPAYASDVPFYDGDEPLGDKLTLSCNYGDYGDINQASLANMPLVAKIEGSTGPSYRERKLRFECKYAILKVTIPESLTGYDRMTVKNGDSDLAVISGIGGLDSKVVYVPVFGEPFKDGYKISGLSVSIENYPGTPTMEIYGGNERKDGSDDIVEPAAFMPNTIYAFDFCNTLTIPGSDSYEFNDGAEVETYELKANTLDYKINISADYDGDDDAVVINAAGANAPKNITINARGHKVKNLQIIAPNSHVEILNGEAVTVTAKTSLNSFVVKPTFKIATATVKGGSIVVEGDEKHDANVSEIVVPEEAENVRVYVGDIKDDSENPVLITNYADKDDVVVVGIKAGDDNKGEYTVQQEGTGAVTEVNSAVAKIVDAQYATLADAFASAKDGETVTLVSFTELSAQVELAGKAITLDLNGQTISWNGGLKKSGIILVHNGADLTINDTVGTGKIYSGGENQAYAAVALTKDGDDAASPAVLTVNGGELEGWYYAVVGNGQRHNTVINIKGGTLKTAEGSAIYNPQNGQINIAGGVVEGYETGIYMKAGAATVATGGTIRATGPENPYKYDGSGANGTGDAIVVDNCGYPGGAPSLKIDGATLVSANAYQVGAYYDGKNATEISDIFSSDNTLTVPAGYEWVESETSGMYKLVKSSAIAIIGNTGYETLADAINAVQSGETITMVADVANAAGISVPSGKNFTVDFGGHTYSVECPGAGSAGTKTQAFQLLENSTIVFKNGTIDCTEANKTATWTSGSSSKGIAMIIQNYANLTLEDMIIDGTNIAHNQPAAPRYVISNNSGNVEFKGNTTIKAPVTGDYAFDVCKYGNYDTPVVTWNSTGSIKGMVELTGGKFVVAKDLAVTEPVVAGEASAQSTLEVNAKLSAASAFSDPNTQISNKKSTAPLQVKRGADLSVCGNGTIEGAETYAAIVVAVAGDNESKTAKLTFDGVTAQGQYYGIAGNGNRHNTEIVINGGVIKGLHDKDNLGIFNPQDGSLTINDGEISGYSSAIEMRAGKLTINGGDFTADATEYKYAPSGSGNTTTGAAIAVAEHNTKMGVTVVLNDGTFTAVRPLAVEDVNSDFKDNIHITKAQGLSIAAPEGYTWINNKLVSLPKADVIKVHPDPDMKQEIPASILETLGENLFYQSNESVGGIPVPATDNNGRMLLNNDSGKYNCVADLSSGFTFTSNHLDAVDVCYIFAAKEDDGTNGEFDVWNADFVVSLDRDVEENEIGLWGFYSSFGFGAAFAAPQNIPANTEIELLGSMVKDGMSNWTYQAIKRDVKVFPCGAFKLNESLAGATLSVDLRIFDPNDHSKYFVIESYKYTFEADNGVAVISE